MPPADLAILGAAIRTLDPARPPREAVAVRDGRSPRSATTPRCARTAAPATEVVDGAGIALVPGLVDSHIHPVPRHRRHARRRPRRPAHARRGPRRARGRARALRAGRVGARLGPLLRRVPRRAASPRTRSPTRPATHPAYVTFFDYHSGLASRPALALAGVDGPREFAAGAAVVCRRRRHPDRELREPPAMDLVHERVPGAHARRAARRLRGDACAAATRSGSPART